MESFIVIESMMGSVSAGISTRMTTRLMPCSVLSSQDLQMQVGRVHASMTSSESHPLPTALSFILTMGLLEFRFRRKQYVNSQAAAY